MNESNFHNLAESIKDGILIANAEGKHVYANRHAADQLGYSIEELLKTELKDLADPEAYPMLQQRLSDRLAGRQVPATYETIIRRKDGTSFPAEVTGSKTSWEGQVCDLVLFRDVTSKNRILNDLQQSKRELSTLMGNLPGMVYSCVNDHEWTMIFISDGSIELTGYLPAELIESHTVSYNDIIHIEDQQRVWDLIQTALKKHETYDVEYRIITKSGSVKHVWERGQGIFDSDGHLHHLEGFVNNITDRKLAEEGLQQSEFKFKALADTSPLAIYMSEGLNQKAEYVNPTFVRLFGYTIEEVPSVEQWWPLAYPEETYRRQIADEWQSKIEKSIKTRSEIEPMDVVVTCKDGSTKNIKWGFKPIGLQNWAFGLDLTEQTRAEAELKIKNDELQKLNAEKDKFFSIIAHDLKSPFTTLLGYSELLADNVRQYTLEHIQEMANNMFSSAGNLFKLLENLLEWSRMKQGQISFNPSKCNLYDVVKQNSELHCLLAEKKCVSVVNSIPQHTIVKADLNMLNGIVRNLLSNAIKFSYYGGSVVFVSEETKDNTILFSISDNGIGIPDEMKEKLFVLGAESSRKGTYGEPSTGLGLLICKEYVEKHKGKIWVESETGKGCTFYITLDT